MLQPIAVVDNVKCSLCANEAYAEYMGLMLCSDDISALAKKDKDYVDTRSEATCFQRMFGHSDRNVYRILGKGGFHKRASQRNEDDWGDE